MNKGLVALGGVMGAWGLVLIGTAVWALLEADTTAQTLAKAGVEQLPEFGFSSIEEWKRAFAVTAVLYLAIGAVIVAGAVGVIRIRHWGRLLMLGGLILLMLLQAYSLVVTKRSGDNVAELAIYVAAVLIVGWVLFRSKLAVTFQQDAQPGVPADGSRPAGEPRR